MNNKFTILIGTCDKYKFLWDKFVTIFNRYWDSDIQIDKYFLSETIKPEFEGFKAFTPGTVPYSGCIKYALDNISTPYVLWMQDDYFLRKIISKKQFQYYFDIIETQGVDRFCFNRYKHHTKYYTLNHLNGSLYQMAQNSNYSISMQASIWNVEFFKSCLNTTSSENPWEFEVNGTNRLNSSYNHKIIYEVTDDYWYQEAMHKGNFTNEYNTIIQEEKL